MQPGLDEHFLIGNWTENIALVNIMLHNCMDILCCNKSTRSTWDFVYVHTHSKKPGI